ncbi:MarR family winged helix-turn-helix transcriptional regulator [Roseobacteraceae bacterium NS-SX3]
MPDAPDDPAFAVFTEAGIINQIATAFLENRLPEGLIAPHFAVLNHLIRVGDGQSPLEAARALQVPKTSFSHTLSVLAARGLVETRPHPGDGRSKQIWITAEGRRVRDETIAALGPVLRRLQERMPPGTLAELLPRLRELRIVMDTLRDEVE